MCCCCLLTHSNRLWFALRSPCGLGCGSGWCGCRSDLSEAELRRFGWWGGVGTQQEELFVGSSLFLWVCVRRMRCCLQVPVMQTPLSQAVAFPVRCRTCSSKGKHWWCCRKGHFALCPSQGSCPAAIPPPQQQPFAECCTAPGFTLSEVLSLQCSAHSCYGNKKKT